MPFDPLMLVWIFTVFLLAGMVKGAVGLGLPTVSLALLVASVGLKPALALIIVPAFVTNLWQAIGPGHGRAVLTRIWPFLLAIVSTIWLGTWLLTQLDPRLIVVALGGLVTIYSITGLTRPAFSLPPHLEKPVGVMVGIVNGITQGMTSSALPGIMYLGALGFKKDAMIQALGIMFVISALVLGVALGSHDILTPELGLISAAVVPPTFIGMAIGGKLRKRLPEEAFRKLFFAALGGLGLYLAIRSGISLL